MTVAEDLATAAGAAGQGYRRTIAGRAYYAVYGLIRKNLIVRHQHPFGNRGKHKLIVEACEADARKTRLIDLGQWLKQLLASRVKADYQWQATSNLEESEVEDAIEAANEAIKTVQSLTPNDWSSLDQQAR